MPDSMTDQKWIAEVRKYAVRFGFYNFSAGERERMLPYLTGIKQRLLHDHRYARNYECNLAATYELMDAMEEGMVEAVTRKLTAA